MNTTQVCRCCLSESCFKDISNEYFHDGQREIYSDMLLATFNINISYQESSMRLICEECVPRLRDAAAFRAQVMRVEEVIVKNLDRTAVQNGSSLLKLMDIKEDFLDHVTGEYEDEAGSGGEGWHADDGMPDDGEPFVVKIERDNNITMEPDNLEAIKKTLEYVASKEREANLKKKMLKAAATKRTKEKPQQDKKIKSKKKLFQPDRKENSLKLINNSNICLFDSLKTKFRCFYCKNAYFNIKELREHSASHANPSYLKMCINRLQGMSYKTVDITDLSCKLCSDALTDLGDLMTHLIEKHEIDFPTKEHLLIPYRLGKEFECVHCGQKFNSYYRLSIHMNGHYTNNVCEICGTSYISRLSLRMHVSQIHKEKKCNKCPATFASTYLYRKHMRKIHNCAQAKRYCLICNKTFRYTYMLNEHKISEHGMKRPICSCPECGKTFLTPVNLRTHIRSVHIRERNYPCSFCGMSFFTSCDQRRHERTHQDIRHFACSYCEGRFKSKDSLRRHLKRQHGNLFLSQNKHNVI